MNEHWLAAVIWRLENTSRNDRRAIDEAAVSIHSGLLRRVRRVLRVPRGRPVHDTARACPPVPAVCTEP